MPIYEYQCQKCGTFEASQRITEPPLRRCPKCKGKVTKLISQTSFQLKGAGWYVTDYASKGNGKSTADDKKAEPSKPEASKAEAAKPASDSGEKSSSGKTEATAA